MIIIIITVLATAKTGGKRSHAGKKPEISINTAKLGGCTNNLDFEKGGGVGENRLAKNVNKTNCFSAVFRGN